MYRSMSVELTVNICICNSMLLSINVRGDCRRPLSKRKAWVLADIVQRAKVYDASVASQAGAGGLHVPGGAARGFAAAVLRP